MEEIKEIITEYAKLHKDYGYLNMSSPMPSDWADTLTIKKVMDMKANIEWYAEVAQKFVDKLSELEATLQPHGYGYRENTVCSEAEYIAQGFTAEEAPKAQRYDTLWNKWVNGEATPNEIAEMDNIQEELGL